MAKHIEIRLQQLMFANDAALLTALSCSVMTPPNGHGAVMSPKATIYHFSLQGKLLLLRSFSLKPTAVSCCVLRRLFSVLSGWSATSHWGIVCKKTKNRHRNPQVEAADGLSRLSLQPSGLKISLMVRGASLTAKQTARCSRRGRNYNSSLWEIQHLTLNFLESCVCVCAWGCVMLRRSRNKPRTNWQERCSCGSWRRLARAAQHSAAPRHAS